MSETKSEAYRTAFEKYVRGQTLTESEQQILDQARLPDPVPFSEAELIWLEGLAADINDEASDG